MIIDVSIETCCCINLDLDPEFELTNFEQLFSGSLLYIKILVNGKLSLTLYLSTY